ncbi:MAG TPA: hypothetical protein VN635_04055 [Conexibacter sp.]|nr:hypothetical protein [Conexibacter sp.]
MGRAAAHLIAATAVAVLLAAAAPASGAFPGRNGVVGFSWFSLQEPELGPPASERAIRTVSPSTSAVQTVVGCRELDGVPVAGTCSIPVYANPAFSPDGRLIAFDAGPRLALVRPDGSGLRLLPTHGADDGEPAFSPPGGRLAFGSDGDVWVSSRDGSGARRIVAGGSGPAWSTRGWIAFVRRGQVWRVRPGGNGLRRLTGRGGTSPAWSPHGTKLAFIRRGGVWTMDANGGHLRRVPRASAVDVAWSPDGRRFAVHVFDSGVWTLRTDGTDTRQLVSGGVNATSSFDAGGVDWQPLR